MEHDRCVVAMETEVARKCSTTVAIPVVGRRHLLICPKCIIKLQYGQSKVVTILPFL